MYCFFHYILISHLLARSLFMILAVGYACVNKCDSFVVEDQSSLGILCFKLHIFD